MANKKEFDSSKYVWGKVVPVDAIELYGSNRLVFGLVSMDNLEKNTTTDYLKMGKGFLSKDEELVLLNNTALFKMELLPDVITILQGIYDKSLDSGGEPGGEAGAGGDDEF